MVKKLIAIIISSAKHVLWVLNIGRQLNTKCVIVQVAITKQQNSRHMMMQKSLWITCYVKIFLLVSGARKSFLTMNADRIFRMVNRLMLVLVILMLLIGFTLDMIERYNGRSPVDGVKTMRTVK